MLNAEGNPIPFAHFPVQEPVPLEQLPALGNMDRIVTSSAKIGGPAISTTPNPVFSVTERIAYADEARKHVDQLHITRESGNLRASPVNPVVTRNVLQQEQVPLTQKFNTEDHQQRLTQVSWSH